MNDPGQHEEIRAKAATLVTRAVLAVVAIWTVPMTSIWVLHGQCDVEAWLRLLLGVAAGICALAAWTPRQGAPGKRDSTAVVLRVLALLGALLWFTETWLLANWGGDWTLWGGLLSWTAALIAYAATGWNPVAHIQRLLASKQMGHAGSGREARGSTP